MVATGDCLLVFKFPYPKKSIFDQFEVRHFNVEVFPKARWLIPVRTIEREFFNEKMGSLAGLKKVPKFLVKTLILVIFSYLGQHSKSICSTYKQKFKKFLMSFLGKVFRNIVINFELSIFRMVQGGGLAVLQGDHFQNP